MKETGSNAFNRIALVNEKVTKYSEHRRFRRAILITFENLPVRSATVQTELTSHRTETQKK